MTPDEAKAVLVAANDAATYHQWAEVDHLLRPVYDGGLLQGTDQGDAAYLLGVAYLDTAAWDAAHYMLTEASTSASDAHRAEAHRRLDEINRQDTATDAAFDGVEQGEAASVLAAADDALARGDYDTANAHYSSVYNGHAEDEPRAKGALGIANVHAHRGELTEAKQYAEYVAGTGVPAAAAGARTLLDWIAQQQGADTAIADGTTADEYKQVHDAVQSAFFSGDYAHVRTLCLSMIDSPQLAATEHAKMAFNAGMAELYLGMEHEAREHFDFAVAHGPTQVADKAQRRLAAIDRQDHADMLVAELADDP